MATADGTHDDNVVSLAAWKAQRDTPPASPIPPETWIAEHIARTLGTSAGEADRQQVADALRVYLEGIEARTPADAADGRSQAIAWLNHVDLEDHVMARALIHMAGEAYRDDRHALAAASADLAAEMTTPAPDYLLRSGRSAGHLDEHAVPRLETTIKILEAINPPLAGPARWSLARTHFALGHTPRAVGMLRPTIDALHQYDPALAASVSLDAAKLLLADRQPRTARNFAQAAKTLFAELEDAHGVASATRVAGEACVRLNDWPNAIDLLDQAAAAFHAIHERRAGHETDIARAQARLYAHSNDPASAIGAIDAADALLREVWIVRLEADPEVTRRFRNLPRVHAEVAHARDHEIDAELFEIAFKVLNDSRMLVDLPPSGAGPIALAAVGYALEHEGDPATAADYWLAANYACGPDDLQLAPTLNAAYRRSALAAGHDRNVVETVAGRVAQRYETHTGRTPNWEQAR